MGEEDHTGQVPFSSHHFKGITVTYHLDLDHLAEVAGVGFVLCDVTLSSPFPDCPLWKEVPGPASGEPGSLSFRVEYLHRVFEILLHGGSVSSSLFINLVHHLLVSVWAHGDLFHASGYNPTC